MEKYYQTDGINSYLVADRNDVATDSFEFAMIARNKISGLLPFEFRGINGDRMIYYRINGMQEMCDMWGQTGATREILMALFEQIFSLTRELKAYMLSPDNLILDMDGIFYDKISQNFFFMYLPEYDMNFHRQTKELMESLLKLVNHNSRETVELAYGLYKILCEEQYSIEAAVDFLRTDSIKDQEEERKISPETMDTEKSKWNNELLDLAFKECAVQESDKNTKITSPWKMAIIAGIIISGAIGAAMAIKQITGSGHIEYVKPLMGTLLLMAVLCFIYIHMSSDKTKTAESPSRESEEIKVESPNPRLSMKKHDSEEPGDTAVLEMFGEETGVLRSRKLFLESSSGGDLITVYKETTPYTIGRDKTRADLILADSQISRVHASISCKNDRFVLEDLDSTNGTTHNGNMVLSGHPVFLEDGDTISFGDIEYKVSL